MARRLGFDAAPSPAVCDRIAELPGKCYPYELAATWLKPVSVVAPRSDILLLGPVAVINIDSKLIFKF